MDDNGDNPYKALDFTSQTYIALHDAMYNFYNEKKFKECFELANKLLLKADLPILIRARCHMVLSRRINSSLSLRHAEQAVGLIDGEMRDMVEKSDFPQNQFDEARALLSRAIERQKQKTTGTTQAKATETTSSKNEESIEQEAGQIAGMGRF